MHILEDITFEKTLRRENKEQVLKKIALFLKEWEENPDRRAVSSKYSVRKIQGKTKLKEVWKFKVTEGDRVLFTKGKYVGWENGEYSDAIILLMYCTHDEQIVCGRNLSKERRVEMFADQKGREIDYHPETSITRVFKYIKIESLIDVEQLQGIYYLNEQQRYCVNADYRPLILFGSAGSGKTTIGIYKLINLVKQNPNIKVGYFTYSQKLAQTAKKIYKTVLQNESTPLEVETHLKQVDFYTVSDLLQENTNKHGIVSYELFNEVFYKIIKQNLSMYREYRKILNKLEVFDIWKEIRGIIKGFAGVDWCPNIEDHQKGILSLATYRGLSSRYTSFTEEERSVIYVIAQKYMAWLKENEAYDENDLSRQILREQSEQRQYDWIVIDEVQDLTEIEIWLLHSFLKHPENFLISGDYHQTIAPTYFDAKRMMTLLELQGFSYKNHENKIMLSTNYRNPRKIVQIANALSRARQDLLGKDKRNDYDQEVAIQKLEGSVITLSNNPTEKIELLREAVKKAYVYIVVATESEKHKLQNLLQDDIRIFTVNEVKGLENKYIIAVNLLTSYLEKWEFILECLENQQRIEESNLYRYLFNLLYVTLTRTQETICFIDDKIDNRVYELLFKTPIKHFNKFDRMTFDLIEASTLEDFYKEAFKFEEKEDYKRAIAQYEKLNTLQAQEGIIRCRAKIQVQEGHYEMAGDLYLQTKALGDAISCYKKAKAYAKYYESLIDYDEEWFMEEILLNPTVSYNDIIKPYLKGTLKEKVEILCLKQYEKKLNKKTEDKAFSLLCMDELNTELKSINRKLGGIRHGKQTN